MSNFDVNVGADGLYTGIIAANAGGGKMNIGLEKRNVGDFGRDIGLNATNFDDSTGNTGFICSNSGDMERNTGNLGQNCVYFRGFQPWSDCPQRGSKVFRGGNRGGPERKIKQILLKRAF